MYDHIGLKVKSLDASVRFYTAALAALGHTLCDRDASRASFGPGGAAAWYLSEAMDGAAAHTGLHVAFVAPDRAAVDRFHAAGLDSGGRDNGAPGLRVEYAPNYYASFLLDPDGNNVEAVCLT
jgi:catechol 2,3-dioxygenase-like lactoylglutathione lyase family enzyme